MKPPDYRNILLEQREEVALLNDLAPVYRENADELDTASMLMI